MTANVAEREDVREGLRVEPHSEWATEAVVLADLGGRMVAGWWPLLVFKRRGGAVSQRLVRRLASLKMLVVDSLSRRIAPTGRVVGWSAVTWLIEDLSHGELVWISRPRRRAFTVARGTVLGCPGAVLVLLGCLGVPALAAALLCSWVTKRLYASNSVRGHWLAPCA